MFDEQFKKAVKKKVSAHSQELLKYKVKNPVYSEILYKLNVRGVYLFEFVREFCKERPTLVKQMNLLEDDGFIQRRQEGNKQVFFVNWWKINEEFIGFLKERSKKLEKYLLEWRKQADPARDPMERAFLVDYDYHRLPYQQLLDKRRVKELIANPLLEEFFQSAFVSAYEQKDFTRGVYDFFEYLLSRASVKVWEYDYGKKQVRSDIIEYSPFDPNGTYRNLYDKEVREGQGKLLSEVKKNKQLTSKQKSQLVHTLEQCRLSKQELKVLYDYAIGLPFIMDYLRKDRWFEHRIESHKKPVETAYLKQKEVPKVKILKKMLNLSQDLKKVL